MNFDKVLKSIDSKEAIHLAMVTNIVLQGKSYLEEVKHKSYWENLKKDFKTKKDLVKAFVNAKPK